ncbi:HD domain-containing phosphohydrolase [uncultured Clostridium sp.]|uniref:response regulator n=1 Tax=uncultured Clostridium sp. TaxID=59620 RepID=UPI00260BAAED|nr:HD domain-containing phosphohydrolase [uncultured Clostridium sp.]
MSIEKKNKVLIIDDVADNAKVLIDILKNDYMLNVALNGVKGIELAKEWKPDLILLDIMMPELDGYEVCRILKSDDRTNIIPVIFLTALSDVNDEYKGLKLGALDYITKPVHPKLLKARIKNYIEIKKYRNNLEELVNEKVHELEQFNNSFVETLALIAETRDSDLGCHIDRCKEYAKIMLDCMRHDSRYIISEIEEINIIKAVPLHDIGKIGIPDNILLKPGKLTDEEFEIMKGHSYCGYRILKNAEVKLDGKTNSIIKCAKEIAYYHHEQWGGTGYPIGLEGKNIPLPARLMMIIDVFDAIVSKRIYKGAKNPEEAIRFIQEGRGLMFDPDLVDIFEMVKDEFLKVALKYSKLEKNK